MSWKGDLSLDAMFLRVIHGLRALTTQSYDDFLLAIETLDAQAQFISSRLEIYEGGLGLPNTTDYP